MNDFQVLSTHPRLLITDPEFSRLKSNSHLPLGKLMTEHLLRQSEILLTKPVRSMNILGRCALGDIRSAYRYVMTLSVSYRLTQDERYLVRLKQELLHWSRLENWNPSHFLDTAECTMFMALSYDWMYDVLDASTRHEIEQAILHKGIQASWEPNESWNHWIDGYNNWVQVCHAGMTAGALAIYQIAPELAQKTIERALTFVPKIMQKSYAPCGAYPEGPVYWGYGTDFNSLLIGILDSACGCSFGLSQQSGFAKTGSYFVSMLANDGGFFNFSDCKIVPEGYFAEIYLIDKFKNPEFYTSAFDTLLKAHCARRDFDQDGSSSDRHFPVTLLYIDGLPLKPNQNPPENYFSTNDALQPVVVHRCGGEDGAYLGIKGGSPGNSHGHMDAGSFLYLSNKTRWAIDLGMPDYSLEKVVTLWDLTQQSSRWQVFKVGRKSHNIIVIGGQNQHCMGRATFQSFDPIKQTSVIDLSSVYSHCASKVIRSYSLNCDYGLCVSDFVSGVKPETPVQFQLCTDAKITIEQDHVVLFKAGQTLYIKADISVAWQATSAQDLIEEFDTPAPELKIISFALNAPPSGLLEWTVKFIPVTITD